MCVCVYVWADFEAAVCVCVCVLCMCVRVLCMCMYVCVRVFDLCVCVCACVWLPDFEAANNHADALAAWAALLAYDDAGMRANTHPQIPTYAHTKHARTRAHAHVLFLLTRAQLTSALILRVYIGVCRCIVRACLSSCLYVCLCPTDVGPRRLCVWCVYERACNVGVGVSRCVCTRTHTHD